jgi:hypothetical protein
VTALYLLGLLVWAVLFVPTAIAALWVAWECVRPAVPASSGPPADGALQAGTSPGCARGLTGPSAHGTPALGPPATERR